MDASAGAAGAAAAYVALHAPPIDWAQCALGFAIGVALYFGLAWVWGKRRKD